MASAAVDVTLGEAFRRIDVDEKASKICVRVPAAGRAKLTRSAAQLRAIAAYFTYPIDAIILL